jgi:hypothetical protein
VRERPWPGRLVGSIQASAVASPSNRTSTSSVFRVCSVTFITGWNPAPLETRGRVASLQATSSPDSIAGGPDAPSTSNRWSAVTLAAFRPTPEHHPQESKVPHTGKMAHWSVWVYSILIAHSVRWSMALCRNVPLPRRRGRLPKCSASACAAPPAQHVTKPRWHRGACPPTTLALPTLGHGSSPSTRHLLRPPARSLITSTSWAERVCTPLRVVSEPKA